MNPLTELQGMLELLKQLCDQADAVASILQAKPCVRHEAIAAANLKLTLALIRIEAARLKILYG